MITKMKPFQRGITQGHCIWCQKKYTKHFESQKFCSDQCKTHYHNEQKTIAWQYWQSLTNNQRAKFRRKLGR